MIAALPLSVSAAGEYVPGNPRWSGYQNQVQWGRPAGAASGDSFEYEAQLLLGDDVVESKAVEIDTYLFFTNDVVTRPQEEYTIRVRARWIMIVGDPDGQYMVADVGEAEPPHEHSYSPVFSNSANAALTVRSLRFRSFAICRIGINEINLHISKWMGSNLIDCCP